MSVVSALGPLGLDYAYGFDRTGLGGYPSPAWKLPFKDADTSEDRADDVAGRAFTGLVHRDGPVSNSTSGSWLPQAQRGPRQQTRVPE